MMMSLDTEITFDKNPSSIHNTNSQQTWIRGNFLNFIKKTTRRFTAFMFIAEKLDVSPLKSGTM